MNSFEPRHNRTLERGTLVGVHWNSHKNKYSVVAFSSRKTEGLVLGYVDKITLTDCTFYINKSKQKNVREKGKKDRHAFIVGIVEDIGTDRTHCTNEIHYNPFRYDTFHARYQDSENIFEILTARTIHMDNVDNKRPLVTFDSVQ